jgi:hypothetical protein
MPVRLLGKLRAAAVAAGGAAPDFFGSQRRGTYIIKELEQ